MVSFTVKYDFLTLLCITVYVFRHRAFVFPLQTVLRVIL